MSKWIMFILLVLALVTIACGITINLPVTDIKTGAEVTEKITVPLPQDISKVTHLQISFGAGEIKLAPGAENALISGTATYNVKDLKPEITVDEDRVSIESGNLDINGIPEISKDFKNEWDLKLASVPIDLKVSAGGYKGRLELGGLALQALEITEGASEALIKFSEPNLAEMDSFLYTTGASNVELRGLANANFENMSIKSGAGSYTLDFSGELKRDATVTIDSGMSSLKIIIPEGVSARVFVDSVLSNVDLGGEWEKVGDQYVMGGDGPTLTINVNMAAGSLELSN